MVARLVERVIIDSANLAAVDPLPADDFNTRYADEAILAYSHIISGLAYTVLAPFQLSRRMRRRNLGLHRRMGRFIVAAGLVSAATGLAFGVQYPWGGWAERSASVVFGIYMGVALLLAVRAARGRDMVTHRRWMIRAFAVALGVAMIRVILIFGEVVLGAFEFDEAFGWAFWGGFLLNAVVAELWLQRWPRSPRLSAGPAVATA